MMRKALLVRINVAFRGGNSWVYIDINTHRIALPYIFPSQTKAIEKMGSPVIQYDDEYWERILNG